LVGPEPLLVVEQREPPLLITPWLPGRPARRPGCLRGPAAGSLRGNRGAGAAARCGLRVARSRLRAARCGLRGARGAKRATALVMVFAAGQFLFGVLVQDHVLFGRLVDPHGDHGQALGVLLLALTRHAVVVLLGPFGMQLRAASNALVHVFPSLLDQ